MKRVIIVLISIVIHLTVQGQIECYLHTDRDFYEAGEALEFKAYVTNEVPLSEDNQEALKVFLINAEGQIAYSIDFPMTSNTLNESLILPGSLSNGFYRLVALGAGSHPDKRFEKKLLINERQIPGVLIKLESMQSAYWVGEKVEVPVSLSYPDGTVAKKKSFRYDLMVNGISVSNDKAKTDKGGSALISFNYPEAQESDLVSVQITVDHKANQFKNGLIIPSKNIPILVSFYPEGGLLIDGQVSRLAFTAHTTDGVAIPLKGNLIGPDDKVVMEIATEVDGLGYFAFEADAGQRLRLQVTEPSWVKTKIELPKIQTNGVVLRFLKQKDNLLQFRAINPIADTYMTVTAIATQDGVEMYNSKLFVQQFKDFQFLVDQKLSGIVRLDILNDQNQIMAQRCCYVSGKEVFSPVYDSYSLSAVDPIFSPELDSDGSLNNWLILGPDLAREKLLLDPIMEAKSLDQSLVDAYMLTVNQQKQVSTFDMMGLAFWPEYFNENYRLSPVDLHIDELKRMQFIHKHFLAPELEFASFFSENIAKLDELGMIPQKLSTDERVQRQLAQGKSILSVIKSVRAYRLMNNQMVFRGGSDSFTDQSGSIIVVDGVPKGANVQILEEMSPYDVATIKVSTSVSDIMKYAGMEDTGGVVIIETRKASPKGDDFENLEVKKYSPTLLWNPNYQQGTSLNLPKSEFGNKLQVTIAGEKQ